MGIISFKKLESLLTANGKTFYSLRKDKIVGCNAGIVTLPFVVIVRGLVLLIPRSWQQPSDLADCLGVSVQAVRNKFSRDSFSVNDIIKITDTLIEENTCIEPGTIVGHDCIILTSHPEPPDP